MAADDLEGQVEFIYYVQNVRNLHFYKNTAKIYIFYKNCTEFTLFTKIGPKLTFTFCSKIGLKFSNILSMVDELTIS